MEYLQDSIFHENLPDSTISNEIVALEHLI